jgi:hypothetical protein
LVNSQRELATVNGATDVALDERSLRPELVTTARLMDAPRAENTRRSYRRAWAAFEAGLADRRRSSHWPAACEKPQPAPSNRLRRLVDIYRSTGQP